MTQEQHSIDIVFTWVDGNDPEHQLKMKPYLKNSEHLHDDVAGPTRFRPSGELLFSVASVFRFAPFVRKIFIVTDNQQPLLQEVIRQHFPESSIQIEIVDHKTIFRGFEEVLPVFSSRSIETMLYRIPGLSEHFVYFNDDFFIIRPVSPGDWFENNKSVVYGYWRSVWIDRSISYLKPRKQGHKPVGYKDGILTAAKTLHENFRYFYMSHAPLPLQRSTFETYFSKHPDILRKNASHKFRHKTQFNPQGLFYLLGFRKGQCIAAGKEKVLFMKPVGRGEHYVSKKIKDAEKDPGIKFLCVESMDMATTADKQQITKWLGEIINIQTGL